ncbi:MAG: polyprenyl diphosphate synthase [Candidatus Micrarchaeia archaeon]
MKIKNIPKIIAIIPDGNRRWAKSHTFSIMKGYDLGVKKFIDFSEWCVSYGINNIAVWAFSTENFSRDSKEIKTLFSIYKKVANDKKLISRLHKNKTRLKIIGNKKLLPRDLLTALNKVEKETSKYKDRVINMLIAYGGKDDIMHAVKEVITKVSSEVNSIKKLNEEIFSRYLISNSISDIDLIIRTSGEERLSGFMPWQTSYSELYFSKKLWPDFTKKDLEAALQEYNKRQRRFGR